MDGLPLFQNSRALLRYYSLFSHFASLPASTSGRLAKQRPVNISLPKLFDCFTFCVYIVCINKCAPVNCETGGYVWQIKRCVTGLQE